MQRVVPRLRMCRCDNEYACQRRTMTRVKRSDAVIDSDIHEQMHMRIQNLHTRELACVGDRIVCNTQSIEQ